MLSKLTSSAAIFPGRVVKPAPTDPVVNAGLTRHSYGSRVSLRLAGQTIYLSQARIVTRPSGRRRHLSRYLVGIEALTGKIFEIFLDTVEGVRGILFQAKEALQRLALRLTAHGLNPRQAMDILGAMP